MLLSTHFNRFYHGVILKEIVAIDKPLRFYNRVEVNFSNLRLDTSKQLLKLLNLDYPRDSQGDAISTRDIEPKELCGHIEFCIAILGENGYTFSFIEEEWARLLKQSEGIKC